MPLTTRDRPSSTRDLALSAGAAAGGAVIFVVDIQQSLDYPMSILYAPAILLGLWIEWKRYPVVAAVIATALLIADLVLGGSEGTPPGLLARGTLVTLVFAATAVLVTRARQMERRSRSDLRQLADLKRAIDHAAIVATTDVHGRITFVNDKFCEISKYAREELLGQDHRIINSGYHPKPFIRDLWQTITSGRVWHGELRNRAKDGSFYWVDTTIVPFLDSSGQPYRYTAIRSDVTALKTAESRLAQQAALARVGQMAAVVAHEVRNPLAGIKGAIQVLISRRDATDSELPVMRDIVTRIDALGELINDLMVFARPRPPRPTALDVIPLLQDAIALLRRDPVAAALEIDTDGPNVAVTADAALVRAAITNLLINAAQAMGGQGRVTLTLREQDEQCVLEIRDSGPGIPADLREQVFEPFYTTKARGGGLGLAIARRTAELHGGTLTLACPTDGGCLFTLALPVRAHDPSDALPVPSTDQTSRSDSAPGRD